MNTAQYQINSHSRLVPTSRRLKTSHRKFKPQALVPPPEEPSSSHLTGNSVAGWLQTDYSTAHSEEHSSRTLQTQQQRRLAGTAAHAQLASV